MACNEYGKLRILFRAVLLSDGVVEINFIVWVLPLGKPTVNISIWNMLMLCCSSLSLNLSFLIWKRKLQYDKR